MSQPKRNEEVDALLDKSNQLREKWLETLSLIQSKTEGIRTEVYCDEDLVDMGAIFRQVAKWADDLRKEATARQELAGAVIAKRFMKRLLTNPGACERVDGRYATAHPDSKQVPKLPKRGTQEFEYLCDYFGINAKGRKAISFHYNRTSELLSELAESGENPPEGLLGTYTHFVSTFRLRRNSPIA